MLINGACGHHNSSHSQCILNTGAYTLTKYHKRCAPSYTTVYPRLSPYFKPAQPQCFLCTGDHWFHHMLQQRPRSLLIYQTNSSIPNSLHHHNLCTPNVHGLRQAAQRHPYYTYQYKRHSFPIPNPKPAIFAQHKRPIITLHTRTSVLPTQKSPAHFSSLHTNNGTRTKTLYSTRQTKTSNFTAPQIPTVSRPKIRSHPIETLTNPLLVPKHTSVSSAQPLFNAQNRTFPVFIL